MFGKMKYPKYENEISQFESISSEDESVGEKWGEVFKIGSILIFRCEFCLQQFQQLINFVDHLEKHNRSYHDEDNQLDISNDSHASFCIDSKNSNNKQNKIEKISFENCFKQEGWKIDKFFASEKEMDQFISDEKIWGLKKKFHTQKGLKKYFRCNRVKSRGEACATKLMTFNNIYTDDFILYRSKMNHTCHQISTQSGRVMKLLSPLADNIKTEIENLFQKGSKIKLIVANIEKSFGTNKSNQVKRYIKILQENQEGKLRDEILFKWIEESLKEPKEDKLAFVTSYEIVENSLRFFISSKHLLNNILRATHVNLIGTKKITWQNYVIYVVGASLNDIEFLCFGIAICSSDQIADFEFIFRSLVEASKLYLKIDYTPKNLCRDANENSEIAFKKIFPSSKTKICWEFVNKCIKRRMEELLPNQKKKDEILNEICQIQKARTYFEFESLANKFLDNWAIFVEFTTYFHNNWIITNWNWFSGVEISFSSTNKSLDSLIKHIEDDHTFRTKIPMDSFKQKILELISEVSHSSSILNKNGPNMNITLKGYLTKNIPLEYTEPFNKNQIPLTALNPHKQKKRRKTSYTTSIKTNIKPYSNSLKDSKRKVIDKKWKEEAVFENLEEAENEIEKEKTWGFMTKSKSKSGIKRYYRCNKVPSRGESCESGIYLYLKADSTNVILVRSGLPHTCHRIPCKSRGISEVIRHEIERLSELNWKTRQVFDYLQEKKFSPMPTKVQINNYIGVLRERKFSAASLNSNEVENWLKSNSEIPNCESKMFVVSYEIRSSNFKFFISSKKLLQNVDEMETLNMDSIRKIEWLKFPVFILATTDSQNKCKCLGIAVISEESLNSFEYIFKAIKDSASNLLHKTINPTVLVTDSNFNIQLAFKNVFGSSVKIKICWDIVKRSVKKSLEELKFEKDIISNIIRDLDSLHRSNSLDEFNENVIYFKKKYQSNKEFFIDFYDAWVKNNNSWYQGYSKISCTSNTRLDNFVKSIRNDQLYRRKISLNDFGTILAKSIECWSFESESRYVC